MLGQGEEIRPSFFLQKETQKTSTSQDNVKTRTSYDIQLLCTITSLTWRCETPCWIEIRPQRKIQRTSSRGGTSSHPRILKLVLEPRTKTWIDKMVVRVLRTVLSVLPGQGICPSLCGHSIFLSSVSLISFLDVILFALYPSLTDTREALLPLCSCFYLVSWLLHPFVFVLH